MAKPFQIVASDRKNEKGKSYTNAPKDINGRLWANLEFNGEGNYGFKDDSFTLKIKFATGVIDTAGHKWLIGSFENGDTLFDIKDQVANGTKDDGKPKYEASPNEEKLKQAWTDDGNLCAILCDPIPQLVYLVEDIAKSKLIFCDEGYEVFPKLNPSRDLLKQINEEIIGEKPDNPSPQRKKNQLHKQYLSENSWFYYAWDSDTIVDCLSETSLALDSLTDDLEETEGTSEKTVTSDTGCSFTFVDGDDLGYLLESCTLPWNAPEVKDNGGKKGWSGGGSVQARKDILKESKDFAFAELGVSSWDEVIEKYGTEICPMKADLIISFAMGSNWTNHHYNPNKGVNWNNYKGTSTMELAVHNIENGKNGNGKEETQVNSDNSSPKNEEPKEELDEVKENKGEFDWISKIEELKQSDPPHIIPKELDEVALAELGDNWQRLYYTLVSGILITPRGNVSFTERNASSFIKSKFGKFPHKMNESELSAVLSNKGVFIPGEDSIAAL